MTGNPLELFRKLFGAVRAIFWLCGSFLAPNLKRALRKVASKKSFRARAPGNVASKSPKIYLNKGQLGGLRATCPPALANVAAQLEVFCFRGWKSPQGLYNHSTLQTFSALIK